MSILGFLWKGTVGAAAGFIASGGNPLGAVGGFLLGSANYLLRPATAETGGLARRRASLLQGEASLQAGLPVIYGETKLGIKGVDLREYAALPGSTAYVAAISDSSRDGGPIEAIREIYFDDELAVDANGNLQGRFLGRVELGKHLGGDSQTVDSELQTRFPTIWTASHAGKFVAYLRFILAPDERFTNLPQVRVVVRGNLIEDPRKNVTGIGISFDAATKEIRRATGSFVTDGWAAGRRVTVEGSTSNNGRFTIAVVAAGAVTVNETLVDEAQSSTETLRYFTWSDNAALCVRDFLLATRYGRGVPIDRLIEPSFLDAADVCDTLGYTCNGAVDTAQEPAENLAALLSSCRGALLDEGGLIRIHIRQPQAASGIVLTEQDFVGDLEYSLPGLDGAYNIVTARFVNPNQDDQVDEVQWPDPGVTTYIDNDGGLEHRLVIDLPFTTDWTIAQAMAQILLKESRLGPLVTGTVKDRACQVQVGDRIQVTHEDPGWDLKDFWVLDLSIRPDALVDVVLLEYSELAYNLDAGATEPSNPGTTLHDPFTCAAPTGLGLAAGDAESILNADGVRLPRIKVTWTAPAEPLLAYYEVQAKRTTDATWDSGVGAQPVKADVQCFLGPVSTESWSVRIRAVNVLGIPSAWVSSSLTPSVTGSAMQATSFYFGAAGAPGTGNPQYRWHVDASSPPKGIFDAFDGSTLKTFLTADFTALTLVLAAALTLQAGLTVSGGAADVSNRILFNAIAIGRSGALGTLPASTTGFYFGYDSSADRAFMSSGVTNGSGVFSTRKPAIFDYSTFTFTRDGSTADVSISSSGLLTVAFGLSVTGGSIAASGIAATVGALTATTGTFSGTITGNSAGTSVDILGNIQLRDAAATVRGVLGGTTTADRIRFADLNGIDRIFLNLNAGGSIVPASAGGLTLGTVSLPWGSSTAPSYFGDVVLGSLGRFDSTIDPTLATDPSGTWGKVLSYNITNSRWQPRTLQLSLGQGVMKANLVGDGTFWTGAWDGRTLSGTPSVPSAPTLTAGYGAVVVSEPTVPGSTFAYEAAYDYYDGATWQTNGGTHYFVGRYSSQAIVHAIWQTNGTIPAPFTSSTQFRYYVRLVGATTGAWSAVSSAVTPSSDNYVNPSILIAASQVACVNLAALVADLGAIYAGIVYNQASSPTAGMRVSSGYSKPGTWTRYIDLAGSGANPMIYHEKLELRFDGSAIFRGIAQNADVSPTFYLDFPNKIFKVYSSGLATSWEIYGESDRVTQDFRVSGGLYWRVGMTAALPRQLGFSAVDSGGENMVVFSRPSASAQYRFLIGGAQLYSGHGKPLFELEGDDPKLLFTETDQIADARCWDIVPVAKQLRFRVVNDADTVQADWLRVNRGTGATITNVEFPTDVLFKGAVNLDDGSTNQAKVATIVVSASSPSGDYPERTLWCKV